MLQRISFVQNLFGKPIRSFEVTRQNTGQRVTRAARTQPISAAPMALVMWSQPGAMWVVSGPSV